MPPAVVEVQCDYDIILFLTMYNRFSNGFGAFLIQPIDPPPIFGALCTD